MQRSAGQASAAGKTDKRPSVRGAFAFWWKTLIPIKQKSSSASHDMCSADGLSLWSHPDIHSILYRSPLFVLILSAVYPFAAGWISDIPTASGSPPSWQFWKTPAPMYGSRQAPAGGTPHRGSRMPASPVPARWSRPARCARTP